MRKVYKNSDKDLARTKAWVKNNPERSRAIKKAYKIRHREKYLSSARAYSKRRRAQMTIEQREIKKSYDKNYHRLLYKRSINHRLKVILRTRLYKAVNGIAKCDHTVKLLGCSIESFKIYIESKFEEGMSWENYGKWHIDHIIPCSLFDLNRPEHQKTCFHFSNLQPLYASENRHKSDKVSVELKKKLNLI